MNECVGRSGFSSINASGCHGEIYKITDPSSIRKLYGAVADNRIHRKIPRSGTVIVKVSSLLHYLHTYDIDFYTQHATQLEHLWKSVLEIGSRDAYNHCHLMTSPAMHIPLSPKSSGMVCLKPSDHIPEFYFAGSNKEYGVYVTVMGVADGTALHMNTNMKTVDPLLLAKIERAVLTLAAAGIEHADLHPGNIMVSSSNAKVTIIDFGLSVMLPGSYQDKARALISQAVSTLLKTGSWSENVSNAIWYNKNNGLLRYVNTYMSKHGYTWYNPSGKFLLYARMHANKIAMDAARVKVWRSSLKKTFLEKSLLQLQKKIKIK